LVVAAGLRPRLSRTGGGKLDHPICLLTAFLAPAWVLKLAPQPGFYTVIDRPIFPRTPSPANASRPVAAAPERFFPGVFAVLWPIAVVVGRVSCPPGRGSFPINPKYLFCPCTPAPTVGARPAEPVPPSRCQAFYQPRCKARRGTEGRPGLACSPGPPDRSDMAHRGAGGTVPAPGDAGP